MCVCVRGKNPGVWFEYVLVPGERRMKLVHQRRGKLRSAFFLLPKPFISLSFSGVEDEKKKKKKNALIDWSVLISVSFRSLLGRNFLGNPSKMLVRKCDCAWFWDGCWLFLASSVRRHPIRVVWIFLSHL